MTSPQTLTEADRRTLAAWAAACAAHVAELFDAPEPAAGQIRDALRRAEAFGRGESTAAAEIRQRMVAVKAASAATTPAGAAAARAIGQAAAVAHMGAHALGAAAYAAKAAALADPSNPDAAAQEVAWQLAQLTDPVRAALRLLPPLGTDTNGPLGQGLLTQGVLGESIRALQADVGHA